jgi:hypothetical protein
MSDIFGWTGCCSWPVSVVPRCLSVVGLFIASWVPVSKRLCVGGVAFCLCGSRRAVIHDVELLFAEWLW